MSGKQELLDTLADLFTYPGAHGAGAGFADRVARCRALADARAPGRGDGLASLEARARAQSAGETEEMFTRTFEINPVCALEVGWHVYGEDYARGALLVRLREELRRLGIPELTELPDHLCHVLRLLGRLDPALADDLAGRYVLPALDKMIEAVAATDCPYTGLLTTTRDVIRDEFEPVAVVTKAQRTAPPGSEDPLPRRLPVIQSPIPPPSAPGPGCAGRAGWEADHGA